MSVFRMLLLGNSVYLTLSAFTFLVVLYSAYLLVHSNVTKPAKVFFVLLCFVLNVYIIVNYLSLNPPGETPANQLFWIRVVMLVTSLISPLLVLFVDQITTPKRSLVSLKKIVVVALGLVSAIFSMTPFVFSTLHFVGGVPIPQPSWGIAIFLLDFLGLFLLVFYTLLQAFRHAAGEVRKQFAYLLWGVGATFGLMIISTVIAVVFFQTSKTVALGPIFPIILVSCFALGIARHNLFNLRKFGSNLIFAFFGSFLLVNILLLPSTAAKLMDIAFLFLLGYLWLTVSRSLAREEALAQHNLELRELDARKSEFITIAAHQLRTPLSVISGYIELMKDVVYGQPTEQLVEVMGYLDVNNGRLVKLVDEFLDISRIEEGTANYSFVPVQVNEIITRVTADLADRASAKGLTLHSNLDAALPSVRADEDCLQHVISNLVDNAVQYTEQGDITVVSSQENEGVSIRVIDGGVGFDEADAQNFFQKFYRGENVRGVNVNYGTGLGLYVAKRFIDAHKGQIWAKSEGVGKGSEFGFWVPEKQR